MAEEDLCLLLNPKRYFIKGRKLKYILDCLLEPERYEAFIQNSIFYPEDLHEFHLTFADAVYEFKANHGKLSREFVADHLPNLLFVLQKTIHYHIHRDIRPLLVILSEFSNMHDWVNDIPNMKKLVTLFREHNDYKKFFFNGVKQRVSELLVPIYQQMEDQESQGRHNIGQYRKDPNRLQLLIKEMDQRLVSFVDTPIAKRPTQDNALINQIKQKIERGAQEIAKLKNDLQQGALEAANDRILSKDSKVAGAMIRRLLNAQKTPRLTLFKWKNYVQRVNNGLIMNKMRAKQLKESLHRIFIRTLSVAYYKWKYAAAESNLLVNLLKGSKLNNALVKVSRCILKAANDRILSKDSKVAGAMIRMLLLNAQKTRRLTLFKWKNYVQRVNNGLIMNEMRAKQLKESLHRIFIRTLSVAYYKWKYAAESNPLVNLLKGSKLNNALVKVSRCILKAANDRILSKDSKVAGAMIRMLLLNAQKTRRLTLFKWKNYVQRVNNGLIMNEMRAKQLKESLHRIPIRTMNGAFNEINHTIDDKNLANAIRRLVYAERIGINGRTL